MDKECQCPLRPHMSYEELMEEIFYPAKYCTVKVGYVCTNALRELDRATKERRYNRYRQKQGHEPSQSKHKRRKNRVLKSSPIDLSSF